jgi:sulfur carrier protein ThiS adenylyltransferase
MTIANFITDRAIRQRELVPPDRLVGIDALVIGVGAIGRQVALQLAALGVARLTLFDDDVVGVENLAPQGYWPEDIGNAKVKATARLCERVHPELEVASVPEKFRRSTRRYATDAANLVAFLCVDSIVTRKMIWDSLRDQASVVIDGRMNAEVVRVLAVDHPRVDRYYATTLFEASEAYAGSCTAQSTIYAASIAAGMMVAQFARHLRGQSVIADQTLNLLAAELSLGV